MTIYSRIFSLRNKKIVIVGSILLVLGVILSTIFIVQGKQQSAGQQISATNLIRVENAKRGTVGWRVAKQGISQIQAYTGETSINIGEYVHLYVSTPSPSYSIDIYRLGYYQGIGARLVDSIPTNAGMYQGYYSGSGANPVDCPRCITSFLDAQGRETDVTDANWKLSNTLLFPSTWVSGIYYIKVTESVSKYQWAVPIVVRDDGRDADFIFQDPVNTDEAYNYWGGTGLYNDFRHPGLRNGHISNAYYVSFARPYNENLGTGFLFDWTYPMLRFMEQNGYNVTYTTNDAVSAGRTNLMTYKGFISEGHDEYWDYSERQKLEQAISKGVSATFFGANAMYWQVRYTTIPGTNHKVMICYRYPELDPYSIDKNLRYLTTTKWRAAPVNNPEDRVLKAMYVSLNANKIQDFVAKNTKSWVYNGTNMKDGDVIRRILGLEVDTTFVDGSVTPNDRITVIGESPYIDQNGKHWMVRAVLDEPVKSHTIIFDASSYVWPEALSGFRSTWPTDKNGPVPESPLLERMTNNIFQRIIEHVG